MPSSTGNSKPRAIATARVYDLNDGGGDSDCRVLIDRIWPRGIAKARAPWEQWCKELAPSTELRRWFNHDPDRWKEFQHRYREELRDHEAAIAALAEAAAGRRLVLVFASRETRYNNAQFMATLLAQKWGVPKVSLDGGK